jgi:hypothetical protein
MGGVAIRVSGGLQLTLRVVIAEIIPCRGRMTFTDEAPSQDSPEAHPRVDGAEE